MIKRWRTITLVVFAAMTFLVAGCSSLEQLTGDTGLDETEQAASDQAESGEQGTAGATAAELAEAFEEFEAPENFLVWAHDLEPVTLHNDAQSLAITSWIRTGLLEGLFAVDASDSFYPQLLAGEPTVTVNNNLTITIDYTLRSNLQWSDGEPLTTDDVLYTHRIWTEGCLPDVDDSIADGSSESCIYQSGSRRGIELITDIQATSETEFTIQMASFFPGWRGMFSEIYAEHAFGLDAAAVNENLFNWTAGEVALPSSGPLLFDGWTQGQSLRLARNDQYHGSVSPDGRNEGVTTVDGVVILFSPDSDSLADLVLSGRSHIVMTQAQPDYEELAESTDFTVLSSPGVRYEHWGLNLTDPHLAKPEVREAIAYALDKSEVVEELYEPLFGDLLSARGLGHTYWMPGHPNYVDHQSKYAGSNIEAASMVLTEAGYREGTDGVYRHPIDGRLSLLAGTTGGDVLREQQLELIQSQMAAAGIEIIIDNVRGGEYFDARPFADDPNVWDITQFARSGGAWPGGVSGFYRSESPSNPYGFVNPEFDAASVDCDVIAADAERDRCYNDLDLFVTTLDQTEDGLFMLPLTQKPFFYGYRSADLSGAGMALSLIHI